VPATTKLPVPEGIEFIKRPHTHVEHRKSLFSSPGMPSKGKGGRDRATKRQHRPFEAFVQIHVYDESLTALAKVLSDMGAIADSVEGTVTATHPPSPPPHVHDPRPEL
jgi:hypothetical protein